MTDEPVRPSGPSEPPEPPEPRDDPRDEPAPFAATVLLTVVSAAAVAVAGLVFPEVNPKLQLLGPAGLMAFEIMVEEVWWRRWWGAIPGAVIGLIAYFEGRAMLADLGAGAWAHPVAFVTAWTLFAVVFALASRYPRTAFTPGRESSPA